MTGKDTTEEQQHPLDRLVRRDSASSIWCSGCGIGIVVNSLAQAVEGNRNKYRVVSSAVGCTGRAGDELNFDNNTTVHTNIFEEAVDLSKQDPRKKIILIITDAELLTWSADGILDAGKKKANILILYINNYLFRVFEECKDIPHTPFLSDEDASFEMTPFNIPLLAHKSGADYIARWTPLHARRLGLSIKDALGSKGLGVIEITSPCLMYHQNMPNSSPLDRMGQFYETSVISHNEPTENLDLRSDRGIIVGKFVGREMDE